jgi:hypothetical protein
MKRFLLTSAMCVALATPALAWDTPAPAPVYNTTVNKSWANYLAQMQSQTQTLTSSNFATGGAGGRGGNARVGNSGNATVGNSGNITFQGNRALAASPYAPSFAGSAPCAGKSQSGGITIPWVGGSEGTQDLDDACRLERNGDSRAARYLLCEENDKIRTAFYQESQDRAVGGEIGDPCPADREKFAKWWFDNQHQEPTLAAVAPETPRPSQPGQVQPEHCLKPTARALKDPTVLAAYNSQSDACKK